MRGLRNPMLAPTVDHKMLAAISYYMRNPSNWTEECNHIPPWETKTNSVPDVRFRLAIEPVSCINDQEGVHHYVAIHVALTPNPDYENIKKLKRYKERRIPCGKFLHSVKS
eukprot:5479456-Amphidinium_carterae.4